MLPCPSPVGRSACRSLAQNPEHRTDSKARSRKVARLCRLFAAVHTSIAIWRIRPACSPLQVLRPRRSRRRRPLLPVGPWSLERSCGTDSSVVAECRCSLLPQARSPVERSCSSSADAAALPLLQQPSRPVVTRKWLGQFGLSYPCRPVVRPDSSSILLA